MKIVKKILIIEDDSLISRLYQKELSFRGHLVEVSPDGIIGLTRVRKFKPDLVLLDLGMPKLDGFGVLDKLQADEMTKKIPVVVLTNNTQDGNQDLVMAKGATMYLIKGDQTPKEVVDRVEKLFSNWK